MNLCSKVNLACNTRICFTMDEKYKPSFVRSIGVNFVIKIYKGIYLTELFSAQQILIASEIFNGPKKCFIRKRERVASQTQ